MNKKTKTMKAITEQLKKIERLKNDFCINVINYGFYSDGTMSVLCRDNEKDIFHVHVDKEGKYLNIINQNTSSATC